MKKYISIFLILLLSISVLSACKHKASTLEEMAQSDEEIDSKITTMFEDSGLDAKTSIVDNTINIVINIENELEGIEVNKENKKLVIKSFEDTFEGKDQEFAKIITNLEDQSGLKDILIRVSITYKDKELWAITYNNSGKYAPEDADTTKDTKKENTKDDKN